jgi:molecular chaperone DnaK
MDPNGTEETMRPVDTHFVVGIDLGTTNSSISVYHRKAPVTLPLSPLVAGPGGRSMPSTVRFEGGLRSKVVVGRKAKEYALIHAKEVIGSIKSVMRQPGWRDNPEVVERLTVEGTLVEPAEIAAMILRELVEQASNSQDKVDLQGGVRHAVICVPANSTDEYRRSVYRAAALAGIGEKDESGQVKVDADGRALGVRLLEEPVAAAIEYGRQVGVFAGQKQQKILVYDLGGGTFDVTILDVDSTGEVPRFKVLATQGVAQLGGDDFDQVMMEMAAAEFSGATGIDLFDLVADTGITPAVLKTAQQELKAAAEQAKIDLAGGGARATIRLAAFLKDGDGKSYDLEVDIEKAAYVERIQPLLAQAQQCVRDALAAAGLGLEDLNRVVLLGGSTKAGWVRDSIRELYPAGEERDPFLAADVDLIVSQGAAFYGESELRRPAGPRAIVEGIVQHHLGVELRGAFFGLVLKQGLELNEQTPVQRRVRIFANPEDADNILISVLKTQKPMEVVEENGEFTTPERHPVHERDERGNDVFEAVGEFLLRGVPRGPAGKFPVIVDMEIDRENLLRVKARCEGVEGDAELSVARV